MTGCMQRAVHALSTERWENEGKGMWTARERERERRKGEGAEHKKAASITSSQKDAPPVAACSRRLIV